jgi:hypothetical protein
MPGFFHDCITVLLVRYANRVSAFVTFWQHYLKNQCGKVSAGKFAPFPP